MIRKETQFSDNKSRLDKTHLSKSSVKVDNLIGFFHKDNSFMTNNSNALSIQKQQTSQKSFKMMPQRNRSHTSIHARLSKEQLKKLLDKRRENRDETL